MSSNCSKCYKSWLLLSQILTYTSVYLFENEKVDIYTVLHELWEFKVYSQSVNLHCRITFSSQKTVLYNPMAGGPVQFSEEKIKIFSSLQYTWSLSVISLEAEGIGGDRWTGNYAKDGRLVFNFSSFYMYSRHVWRKSLRTLEPVIYSISSFWPSLPSGVDAAYEATNKDIVFIFKGNYYIIKF